VAIERINIISDDPIDVSYDAPQSIRVIDDSEVRVVRVVENAEAVDHIGVFSDNPSIISDNVPPIIKIIDESEIKVVKIIESGPQGRPGTSGIITNGAFTGSFSGSFVGNGSGLTDIVSASYALSASYAPGALIDGATYNITSSWAISASYVSSQYYATFSQPSLATTWSFNHNLNYKYPIITVWNTEDEVIIPEKIFAASTSQSIVYFPVPVSGYASATVGSILPTSTGSTGGSATLPSNVVSSSLQFFTITAPFTGSFTGSFTGDGFGLFGVTATLPSNIVSSSTQITYSGISSIPSGIVSSSLQFSNITSPFTGSFKGDGSGLTGITATLPSNIVSSSSQITYSGITGAPSNLISSSFQIASDISGSFNSASSSFSTRVTNIEAKVIYSGSFSGSFVGNGSGLTGITAVIPPNIVSSSLQFSNITSPFTGSFTGSFKGDGSGLTGITTTLPPNIVSSSAQISYSGITNVPSNIVSSSSQITYSGISSIPSGIVSSSLQFKTITDAFTGSFTGSFKGDGSGLLNIIPPNVVSSSAQISYTGITNVPSNIISSSLQFFTITAPFTGSFTGSFRGDGSGLTGITTTLPPNILSSSFQIASDISGSFNNASSSFSNRVTTLETKTVYSGSFSGSFVGNGSGLTNIVSASYALSASYAPGGSSVQTIGTRIQTEDSYITAGSKGYRHINSNSTIIKTRTISTITGSIDINIRRNGTTLGNVSLVNQTGSIDTTLSGWTTTLYRDDLLEFYVSGSSTYITDIILFIDIIT